MSKPKNTRFGLVLLLWVAGLCAAAQFAKFSVVFPTIQTLYPGWGPSVGFLVSIISLVGIVLGTSAGMIVARIGFRRLLLSALLLGALTSAYQATLPSFSLMMVSRVIEGLSHLVIVVAAPTLIAQVSAPRHRPFTLTLWGTFFGVAFSIVAWFGLPLVSVHGVHMLFLAHAGAMAAIALLLYFKLPRLIGSLPETLLPGFGETLRRHAEIYRSPSLSAPSLGWLFYTLTFVSMLTLLPETVPDDERAFVIAAMPIASIASSMTFGIWLLRYTSSVSVIVTGFALSIAVVVLLGFSPGSPALCIALFCALGLVQGASFAAVPELNGDARTQAYANGALAQMGNLGNTCGTPLLLAVIVSFGFNGAVFMLIACYVLGIAVHLIQQKRRALLSSV
ncbi:MAG: MFS transporter [Pseudomonadota bacterium]